MEVTTRFKASKTAPHSSAHAQRSVRDVLHLEIVMQRVLAALPLSDLRGFLAAVGGQTDLLWLLQDAALWEELLVLHFGGRRHVGVVEDSASVAGSDDVDDNSEAEDEEDGEDEDDEEEQDDEDDEEEESGAARPAGHEQTAATGETMRECALPATETRAPQVSTVSLTEELPLATMAAVLFTEPKWLDFDHMCTEATEFLVSMYEWFQFQQRVHVIRGDISTIEEVGDTPIDAIAFPGSQSMQNPHSGVATAVFDRAGLNLESHTQQLRVHLRSGQSYVTPGFDSGVRVLIHCHGPYIYHHDLFPTLAKTYRSVLRHAQQEQVQCLAMASISTGNFGVPVVEASRRGLKAIQQYLRSHHEWQGRVGIVCFESHVFEAFQEGYQRVLSAFNSTAED